MKRLLILSRSSHPHGGADRIIRDLCHTLPAKEWEVLLGLAKGRRFNLPDNYRQAYPGLPIIEIDGSLGTRRARLSAISGAIMKTRPDVVLTMRIFDAYEAVASIKNCRGRFQPRLAVGVRSYEAGYLSDVRRYRGVIDGCMVSGELIAHACVAWSGIESERVFNIPGGVQIPPDRNIRHFVRHPVRLLYAGRLDEMQKRATDIIPFVIELDRMGIPFQLTIAGDGSERHALERKLQPWIDRGSVRMLGWVCEERLYRELYPDADVFIHFAEWEGVTIAPREAMAHGVVPVISRFTGINCEHQFVDGKNALTFDVGNIQAAAACVARLRDDAVLYARLSESAAQSQTGPYSYDGARDAWDHALASLLEKPPKLGVLPDAPETLRGLMAKSGLNVRQQHFIRKLFKYPVRHADAGSEWPTGSGLLTGMEQKEILEFAVRAENESREIRDK